MKCLKFLFVLFLGLECTMACAATLGASRAPIYTGIDAELWTDPDFGLAGVSGYLDTLSVNGSVETAVTEFGILGLYDDDGQLTGGNLIVLETVTSHTAGVNFFLTGDLVTATDVGLTWELLFYVTGGEAAYLYGSRVLVSLIDIVSFEHPQFRTIEGTGDVSISAFSPIPVPASLPLLTGGLGIIALMRLNFVPVSGQRGNLPLSTKGAWRR